VFASLLENANETYDKWLDEETTARVKREQGALKALKNQRYKRHAKRRGKELEKIFEKRLRLTTELNPSSESEDSGSNSDDSDAQSDKENQNFAKGIRASPLRRIKDIYRPNDVTYRKTHHHSVVKTDRYDSS
jgi:hypothetical protein